MRRQRAHEEACVIFNSTESYRGLALPCPGFISKREVTPILEYLEKRITWTGKRIPSS